MQEFVENAVQAQGWYHCLPRPEYKQWKRIDVQDDWFEVYELPGHTFALYEPGHFQEVISFLICGSQKALLFDTGMGIGNIKKVVEQLTTKEILVVNSHFHFDHIGGNHLFPSVAIYNEPLAVKRLQQGFAKEELAIHLLGDSVCKPYPPGFNPAHYTIPPVEPLLLAHGDIINLGDRRLHILHTPGHTPDSIMLWEPAARSLYTGDTFYPAALYTHFHDTCFGYSDFYVYMHTMDQIAELAPNLEYVYTSHNLPLVKSSLLSQAAKAFHLIKEGSYPYRIDSQGLRRYEFQDFAVITPGRSRG